MESDLTIALVPGERLAPAVRAEVLRLCSAAYDEDFAPYLRYPSPVHVLGYRGATLVSHAMWVTRWLQAGDSAPLRTAYVEAVATEPREQGRGYASALLRRLAGAIGDYDLGALSPSDAAFYRRLGWEDWRGPLAIRADAGLLPTPDEEVMILRLPRTGPLDLGAPLSAEWREGELW